MHNFRGVSIETSPEFRLNFKENSVISSRKEEFEPELPIGDFR